MQVLIIVFCLSLASISHAGAPEGWEKLGTKPGSYTVGIDQSIKHSGRASAYLQSVDKKIGGFGNLMQSVQPKNYLGKRVRFSAFVLAKNIADWGGLWMRVDGEKKKPSLGFDNMQDRPIKGSSDWKNYQVVLDVPKTATNISFGFLIVGTGKFWMDECQFEIVEKSVPVTRKHRQSKRTTPENLGFDQ